MLRHVVFVTYVTTLSARRGDHTSKLIFLATVLTFDKYVSIRSLELLRRDLTCRPLAVSVSVCSKLETLVLSPNIHPSGHRQCRLSRIRRGESVLRVDRKSRASKRVKVSGNW